MNIEEKIKEIEAEIKQIESAIESKSIRLSLLKKSLKSFQKLLAKAKEIGNNAA